jgi:hypothetical protein
VRVGVSTPDWARRAGADRHRGAPVLRARCKTALVNPCYQYTDQDRPVASVLEGRPHVRHLWRDQRKPEHVRAFTEATVRAARGIISVTVGKLELLLPATGGSTPAFVEFPQAAVAEFMPDFDHQITALVDPDDVLADRNEGNNSLTVVGTCGG